MKNWKKVMAMLCAAAMVTGSSAPVWAEADAAENQQAQLRPAKIQGNKPRRRRGRSSRKPAAKPDATSDNQ